MAEQRCAVVAVLGAPNAGKSTLVNTLVGAKVAAVTQKVQTTRALVRGIAMRDAGATRPDRHARRVRAEAPAGSRHGGGRVERARRRRRDRAVVDAPAHAPDGARRAPMRSGGGYRGDHRER